MFKWVSELFSKFGSSAAQALTGKDNQTPDIGRWSWLICVFAIIGAAAWNARNGSQIDLVSFATALSIIAGGHGAAIWAKKDTEPSPSAEPQS